MQVVHVSNYDTLGGASRAAYRLHRALLDIGIGSEMLVGSRTEKDSTVAELPRGPRPVRSVDWRVHQVLRRIGVPDLAYPSAPWFYLAPRVRRADVIHLHKIHGGHFSLALLPFLSSRSRVVWTLHDMWALTGYCYHSLDCDRWRSGCGSCPQIQDSGAIPIRLEPPLGIDTTGLLWRAKRAIYRQSSLVVAAPSRWLYTLARESPLFHGAEIRHIPYSLDLDTFHPYPRREARQSLELPAEAKIVLFIPGKGDKDFEVAMAIAAVAGGEPATVVTLGLDGPPLRLPTSWRGISVPYVRDETSLAAYYSAADVYVHCAYIDNFPNTILESLACGTPVVAYAVGGVPDMVRHERTGYLARPRTPEELSQGLRWLLRDEESRRRLGEQAREMCVTEFAPAIQARAYAALYNDALGRG